THLGLSAAGTMRSASRKGRPNSIRRAWDKQSPIKVIPLLIHTEIRNYACTVRAFPRTFPSEGLANLATREIAASRQAVGALPQRGRFFVASLQLEDHPFDVSVILVAAQELQALLRIAPFQNSDRLRTCAPGIHFTLVRHIKIY